MLRLKEHGDRVKAFFIIKQYMKKASLGTNGMVGEAFFTLYLHSLRFKNNKLLQSAMGMSKGSVTVEAFLYALYRNALRLGFDAIRYKNSTYRMQQRFFVLMANKVGVNVRTAFAKWGNRAGALKFEDLERTFKFAACAARLASIFNNFYI